jgi:hypothetical protein
MFGRGSDSVILDVMTDRQDCSAAFVSPFLWDSDPDVRRRAFAASAKMDRNVAIGVAGKALGDSHHGVRSVVSSFLVGEGNAALPVLELALKDTSSVRRLAALRVLGQFDEGRSLLEGAVRSADWQNRFIATEGLAEIGDESSIAILTIRVEVETHPRVVEALTHALVRGGKDQDE